MWNYGAEAAIEGARLGGPVGIERAPEATAAGEGEDGVSEGEGGVSEGEGAGE